jgi:hypothetical protein
MAKISSIIGGCTTNAKRGDRFSMLFDFDIADEACDAELEYAVWGIWIEGGVRQGHVTFLGNIEIGLVVEFGWGIGVGIDAVACVSLETISTGYVGYDSCCCEKSFFTT